MPFFRKSHLIALLRVVVPDAATSMMRPELQRRKSLQKDHYYRLLEAHEATACELENDVLAATQALGNMLAKTA